MVKRQTAEMPISAQGIKFLEIMGLLVITGIASLILYLSYADYLHKGIENSISGFILGFIFTVISLKGWHYAGGCFLKWCTDIDHLSPYSHKPYVNVEIDFKIDAPVTERILQMSEVEEIVNEQSKRAV